MTWWISRMKKTKQYNITQCALYKCKSKKRLATLLQIDYSYLIEQNFISYRTFLQTKKGSYEKRVITAPNNELKRVQRRILQLLQPVMRPPWLISSQKEKSYIDNGKAHINAIYALTLDIQKFYDNCSREYVYQFFLRKLKTSPDVAKILADIVIYEGCIPTGSPTGQILAYYAYEDMFNEIATTTKAFGGTFTLFVDDTTTSSTTPFDPKKVASEIDIILRKYGHKPKYKKVRYFGKNKAKPVTGTIITSNNALEVPNSLQAKIYEGFQKLKESDNTPQLNAQLSKELSVLVGQAQAAQNINPKKFREIHRITRQRQKEING